MRSMFQALDVGKHGFERRQVSVDVGDDCDAYNARLCSVIGWR